MTVIDADAHVEEWAGTFDDTYFDPSLAHRKPRVVRAGSRAYWVIDDQLFPRMVGKGSIILGTPTGYDDEMSAMTARKPEGLDSMELRDPDARVRQMDKEGIALQVIYPSLFLAWPLTEDPRLEVALCRSWYAWMADICGRRVDRLRWVAPLPMGDVATAVGEMRHAKDLGAVGIVLLGTREAQLLSDAEFLPLFAEASRLRLPIAIHVGWSCPALTDMCDDLIRSAIISFMLPVPIGLVSIATSEILEMFPTLRFAFLEAGCQWVPFIWDRMHDLHEMAGDRVPMMRKPPRPLREYVERGNIYFGCEVDERLLPTVIDMAGEECLLYASDIPHADRIHGAVGVLRARRDISESAKAKILGENAARFYAF